MPQSGLKSDGPSTAGRLGSRSAEPPRFDALYLEYQPMLVRFARSRNAIDPEGVANLALLDLLRALDRLRSDDPRVLRSYLFKAATSHMARERRKHRVEPVPIDDVDDLTEPFDEIVAGSIDLDALLDSLPPDQRAVLRHRFVDDLSAEETAVRLGKTSGAVRMIQHRAIQRLRRVVFASAVVFVGAAILIGALLIALRAAQDDRPTSDPADGTPESSVDGSPSPEADEESGRSMIDVLSVEDGSAPGQGVDPAATVTEPGETVGPAEQSGPTEPSEPLATGLGDPVAPIDTTPSPGSPIIVGSATAGQASPSLAEPGEMLAYEGFQPGIGDPLVVSSGPGAVGFVPGSPWVLSGGEATVSQDPTGLTYRDSSGTALATTPGGLRVEALASDAVIRREYADPELLAVGSYWVSFLIRPDRAGIGDAFWTPDGHINRGAAGIQQYPSYRFVNGNATDVLVEQGRTALVVVHVRPAGSSLWVDPNLTDLGLPAEVFAGQPSGPSPDLMLGFNSINDGAYTFDEVRIGTSARSVLPIG